ncbi:hypothetical protein ACSFB8_07545 [Enterococcus faecalis]
MTMQALGLKSRKVYAKGVDKAEVSRLLIHKFSKFKGGITYPEPLIYEQKSDSAGKR